MKKLTLGFMLFALAAATMFTSCKKDDDGDSSISELSASLRDGKFSTATAAFYASKSSENTGTSKLGEIFSSTDGSTTIMGTSNGKQLAITIKGTASGTYELNVSANNAVNNALINLLSGKTVEESIKDAVDVKTDAMVIYRATGESEGGSTYWFSTKAKVNFNLLAVYATGDFTASMTNQAGDKFEISDGKFKVFGKPVTQ